MPGLDRLYDLYSFNVIPALGRTVTGDAEPYRYLVESIRKFPQARRLRRHDPRGRLPARVVSPDDRRHRRAAFGLASVIIRYVVASFVISVRFPYVPPGPRRASCSRARARWRWSIRSALPLPARLALRLARLIERPTAAGGAVRLASALDRARARPTSSSASSWRPGRTWSAPRSRATSKACRTRWRRSRRRRPKPSSPPRSASRSPSVFASFGPPVAAASIAQVHQAEVVDDDGRAHGRRQGAAAGRRAAASASTSPPSSSPRALPSAGRPEARRLRLIEVVADARALRHDRDGPAARGGGAVGDGREHRATIPISACRRSTGSAPPATS